jgi:hypothetical protein
MLDSVKLVRVEVLVTVMVMRVEVLVTVVPVVELV